MNHLVGSVVRVSIRPPSFLSLALSPSPPPTDAGGSVDGFRVARTSANTLGREDQLVRNGYAHYGVIYWMQS